MTPSSTPKRRRYTLAIACALFAGLLLRLWLVARFAHIQGDTLLYGDIAQNWLQHGVYGFTRTLEGLPAPPRPTLIRLPGYPLFLAACFRIFGMERYGAVLLVQVILDLADCWLLSRLARRIFGQAAELPALWLATLCPFTAIYVAAPLTETFTLLAITAAFYGLVRWQEAGAGLNRWMGLIAAALAYSILLRPEQGMLAACVIPAMLWIGYTGPGGLLRAMRPALIVAVLTLLPLVPWTIRNERTFHVFQPLAPRSAADPGEANPSGFQCWYRTWAIDFASTETVYWNYDGDEIHIADLPVRAFDSDAQYVATQALLEDYNVGTSFTPPLDARFNALALDRIHANPLRYYLALPIARVFNMMFRPRAEALPLPLDWWDFHQHWRTSLVTSSLGITNLGYFALAAVGFRRRRTRALNATLAAPILWSMLATILLRCLLLLTLDNSETRYTLEFFPVLIVLGAAVLGGRRGYLQRVSLKE